MMITLCLWFAIINYYREPALRVIVICSTSADAPVGLH